MNRLTVIRSAAELEASSEPTICPPWPDVFMMRLMEKLAPFEGRAMTRPQFRAMLYAAMDTVQLCVRDGILGAEAECFEAEPDGDAFLVVAIRDHTICEDDLVMRVEGKRVGPELERPPISVAGPIRGLEWKP